MLEVLRRGAISPRVTGGATVAALFAGSTLLTPIYDLYRASYGFSSLELTSLYAVYVVGNLTALLALGRLSDQGGRRPVVLAGLALSAVSTLLFLFASRSATLFAGRALSGCAVGLGSGAATAWITEAARPDRRAQAASTMTAFNFIGLALGSVLAGLLVQYASWPQRTPFLAYLGVLAATTGMALLTPETLDPGARAPFSLKPRLGVPPGARRSFAAPAAAGFSAMAVVGFYAALGPIMIRQALGVANRAVAAAMVAELFAVAAIVIVTTRGLRAQPAMRAGLALTPLGLGLLVAAQWRASPAWLLAATAVCGAAAALGYRGGLAAANDLAPADRRAEVASTYFVCCFLGNALPIIGVGALSQLAGERLADLVFGLGVSALAACALVWTFVLGGARRRVAASV